jgi:hypothetical protein
VLYVLLAKKSLSRFRRLEMHNVRKKVLAVAIAGVLPFALCAGQAQAQSVMDFDNPAMPAAVFGTLGQSYAQGGFETTSIDFNDAANVTSHIHGADSGGSRVSQLEADAGGALFRSASGADFSFDSWDMVTLNTAITTGGDSVFHVAGLNNGATVADITLTSADTGAVDFLALDSGFGNVDQVEYWFDAPGRGEDPAAGVGLLNLLAEVDNVSFSDAAIPPIPEPETYAMLLVGLGLVGFAAHRRRNYY